MGTVLTQNPLILMRRKAGLQSSDQAASKLGVKTITVKQIESGKLAPSFLLLARMAQAYGVTDRQLRVEIRKARRRFLKKQLART